VTSARADANVAWRVAARDHARVNLAANLTKTAEQHGDHPAVKLDDYQLDFRGLDDAAAHAAGFLRGKGVGPGDRVAIMLPNIPHFPIIYYGALRLGAVIVPMNPLLKGREVQFYLEDSGAKVLCAFHGFAEAAQTAPTRPARSASSWSPARSRPRSWVPTPCGRSRTATTTTPR
jgi:acyl-CoA synthetase (AMP-forming)/AMP-acid ligase II